MKAVVKDTISANMSRRLTLLVLAMLSMTATAEEASVTEGQRYQPFQHFTAKADDAFMVYAETVCKDAAAFASLRISATTGFVKTNVCQMHQHGASAYRVHVDFDMPNNRSCDDVVVVVTLHSKEQGQKQMAILSRGSCSQSDDYAFIKDLVDKDPSHEYRLCQYVANVAAWRHVHQREEHDDGPAAPGDRVIDREPNYHIKCIVDGDTVTLDMQLMNEVCKGFVYKSQADPEKHEVVSRGSCMRYKYPHND